MKPGRMKKKKKSKSNARVAPAPASRVKSEIILSPDERKSDQRQIGFFGLMKRKARRAMRVMGLLKSSPILMGDAAKIAEYLEFSMRDVDRVKIVFDDIDFDESGEIDYDEFLKFCDEQRSPYTDALMNMVDEEGTGVINFNMFFRLICMYSVYTQEDILQFVFQTFDKDSSGTLDEEEFMDLARTVNNADPLFPGNFKNALERFDCNDDGLLDYKEFKEINKDFPMVFYPAFRIQDKWHKCCLGEQFWVDIAVNMQRRKYLEEYMLSHNGQLPPPTFKERIRKLFCICCSRGNRKFEAGGDRRKRRKKDETTKRRKRKTKTKDLETKSSTAHSNRLTAREKKMLVEKQIVRKTVAIESKVAW